jgi:type II secretory pathway component PulF
MTTSPAVGSSSAPGPFLRREQPAQAAVAEEIVVPHPSSRKPSPMREILASLSHIGMGKQRLAMIQNLSTMMMAGLPLIDSLRTLHLEARSSAMKHLLRRVITNVENGIPLWRSLDEEHFFSAQAIALVRIGEEAGNLAENLERLAIQQEKDQALRSKIMMAMIYPVVVLVLMFILVMGLGMFVLPKLIGVLFSLNVPLPLVTRILIAFTNFMSAYGFIVLPVSIVGAAALAVLGKYTRLNVVFQWMTMHIPGIGQLLWQATIARFGVILGGLLQAGVPLVEAIKSLADVTPTVSYRKFYTHLLERVTLGDSFGKVFAETKGSEKLLPLSVQQLVMTGEKTGTLSEILLKIAEIYEKKANDTAQVLPVILEPVLLLFIGGLVATIAFAVIIPIYSVVGSIGH